MDKLSQAEVHYRPALVTAMRFCVNCAMYTPKALQLCGSCDLVESAPLPIRPWNVCDRWVTRKNDEKSATSTDHESKAA